MTALDRVGNALAGYHGLLGQLGVFAVVALGVYAAGRVLVVRPLVRVVRSRNRDDPTLAEATALYARIAVAALAFVLATAAAGFGRAFQGSALVIAAVTLALGVAGQDVIGNLVSGVFLVADPDFHVGDYVRWDGGEGTVQSIDYRVTRVRTAAGESVTVPNSQLTTSALVAPYTGESYRVSETFGVRYGDDVEAALRLAREAAEADDRVLADPAPVALADGFGSSSVTVVVRFWVGDPARTPVAEVRSAYVRRVTASFADAGLTLNPPSQHELSGEVEVADDAGGD